MQKQSASNLVTQYHDFLCVFFWGGGDFGGERRDHVLEPSRCSMEASIDNNNNNKTIIILIRTTLCRGTAGTKETLIMQQ